MHTHSRRVLIRHEILDLVVLEGAAIVIVVRNRWARVRLVLLEIVQTLHILVMLGHQTYGFRIVQ
jgi:hypothetical protein